SPLPWRAMPTSAAFAEAALRPGADQLLLVGGAADGGVGAAVRAVGPARGDFMGFMSHPDLDVAREVASAVAWNGFLYAVGGNDRTAKPPIQKAVVNADGSLGPWTTAGHLLQEGDCAQAVAANGYLYTVGGCDPDNGGPNGHVAWAPFLANGDVGAFQSSPEIDIPSDNLGWRGLGSVVHANGFLYVAGYTRSNVVLFSALDRATGKPGPWQATTALPTVQGVGTAFLSTPSRLYVVAGAEDVFGDYRSEVYTGELASDGRVLGWNRSPFNLPIAVRGMASGVWNGALHVVSGCNGTNYCDGLPEVAYLAPILGDGGVGPWSARGTIPTPRRDPGSAVVQGRLYALGGKKNIPTVEVESAALDPAGVAGPWSTGPALPAAADVGQGASTGEGLALVAKDQLLELHDGAWRTLATLDGRTGAAVAATDTALVVLGGASPTTQVTVARRLADGGVAVTAASPLPVAEGRTSAVGVGRDVFLLSAAGDAILGARVDDGGALGAFTQRSALPDARPDATLAIGAGALLLAGGRSEVLGAALLDGGGLGPWRTVGWLPSPRARPLLAVRDGFLYLVSGARGAAAGADVWSALLGPSGTLGPFQNLTSLPGAAARGTAGVAGNALVVAGGAGDAASSEVWRAPLWGPRLVGRVSATVDLERAVSSLDALTVQSSSGLVSVALRTRDADGALGPSSAAGAGQGQGLFTPALTSVRGLELLLGLDDGLGAREGPACRLTGVRAAFTR
ncbi:MAG: hypothetical protein K1X89_32190, partial [Myxococcaceae bacterium]|nr:hypothetical protein [Myxococcaceae bacterium]